MHPDGGDGNARRRLRLRRRRHISPLLPTRGADLRFPSYVNVIAAAFCAAASVVYVIVASLTVALTADSASVLAARTATAALATPHVRLCSSGSGVSPYRRLGGRNRFRSFSRRHQEKISVAAVGDDDCSGDGNGARSNVTAEALSPSPQFRGVIVDYDDEDAVKMDEAPIDRLRATLERLNADGIGTFADGGGRRDGGGFATEARLIPACSSFEASPSYRDNGHRYPSSDTTVASPQPSALGATDVNSLLFLVSFLGGGRGLDVEYGGDGGEEGVPILVVIPSSFRVDRAKLRNAVVAEAERLGFSPTGSGASFLGTGREDPEMSGSSVSVYLAPSHRVKDLCGFDPGTVPPCGHFPNELPTIIDKALGGIVVGGGGLEGTRCLVSVEALRRGLGRVVTADLVAVDGGTEQDSEGGVGGSQSQAAWPAEESRVDRRARPFFPVAPPPSIDGEAAESSGNLWSDSVHTTVTAVGRLSSVRQLARRLVFADLVPPDHAFPDPALSSKPKDEAEELDLPWRSGEDGRGMAVQLIAGKTLCEALGEEAGPRALRRMKPGRLVLVRGRTNVGKGNMTRNTWTDSAGNWMRRRNLDVVVTSFEILEDEVTPARDQGGGGPRSGKKEVAGAVSDEKNSGMPFLALSDIYGQAVVSPKDDGSDPRIFLVDCATSLQSLSKDLSSLMDLATSAAAANDGSASWRYKFAIGIDCEWRPGGRRGEVLSPPGSGQRPISLLQISIPRIERVFLVDVYQLLRSGLSKRAELSYSESMLDDALLHVLTSARVLKVGFAVASDLRRLAASFPHMRAFREIHAVVDVQSAARSSPMGRTFRLMPGMGSLRRLTMAVVGRDLDKSEQCSDWERRPLSPRQVTYAAVDAAAPPFLLEEMVKRMERTGVDGGHDDEGGLLWTDEEDFVLSKLCHSWRFLVLMEEDDASIGPTALHRLKAKKVVDGVHVVSQSWPIGRPAPEPAAPPVVGDEDGPYTDKSGIRRVPSRLVCINVRGESEAAGPSPDGGGGEGIPEESVAPFMGLRMGWSKAACLERLVSDSLEPGARLEFNPKSGYVELKDAVVLFVNHPGKTGSRGRRAPYPNEWLEDGRVLTWFLQEKEWRGGKSELATKLLIGRAKFDRFEQTQSCEAGGKVDFSVCIPTCVLFVRTGDERDEFICCGRCSVMLSRGEARGVDKGRSLVPLHLKLLDWPTLRETSDFASLVLKSNANDDVGGVAVLESAVDNLQFQEDLANMVLSGDVVGALAKALDAANTSPRKRSIEAGIGCLKTILARSDHPDVVRAVEALDDAVDRLGLF